MASSKLKRKLTHLKPIIISLRKSGKTYSEIREIYNIPKPTLSNWLRKVKMPKRIEKETRKRAFEKWRAKNKILSQNRSQKAAKVKKEFQEKASKEIKKVSINDLKLIGSALYWTEGNIKNRHRLQFGNSNPSTIKVIMRFFREICNILDEKIKTRIHLYPGINQQKATNYWRKITGLPKENFHPPQIQISRASKGKRPRNTLSYGTLHLTMNNTEMTCKVKGWI